MLIVQFGHFSKRFEHPAKRQIVVTCKSTSKRRFKLIAAITI